MKYTRVRSTALGRARTHQVVLPSRRWRGERRRCQVAALELGLWRALGIAEIDLGVMVGRCPKVRTLNPKP